MTTSPRPPIFRAVSACWVLALVMLAAMPTLSGCKGDSPAVNGQTETVDAGRTEPAGVRRPAPPERPELADELFNNIVAGNEPAAIQLVEQGAPVNAVNNRGASVLHYAVRMTMPNLTRLLLEYGAHMDVADPAGLQPIDWAARRGAWITREGNASIPAEEVIDTLLEYGADINARTPDGDLPIRWTIEYQSEIWREFMISRGSLPR